MSDRRTFLKYVAGSFSVGALTNISHAFATEAVDPAARFVLIRVHGAMDSVMGLHPHLKPTTGIDEKDLFLGYDPATLALKYLEGTQITLGPAAEPISQFARKMAIVRGMYMGPNDLGHPFAIQHISSGRTQESAPHWTSYIGSHFRATGLNVVTNAPLQRGTIEPFPTLLTTVLRAKVPSTAKANQATGLSVYGKSNLGVGRYLEFLERKERLAKFMEIYEAAEKETDATGSPQTKVSDADLVIASLYSGMARVAQLDLTAETSGGSLDNHADYARLQPIAQKARWTIIGKFLDKLQNLGLLEHTLVAVVTEFNRTPGLNDNGGKDHNYTDNAAALFGRGVNGGTVIGDRTLYKREDGFPYAYWAGTHIEFGKGQDLVRPGDLWASVAHSFDAKLAESAPEDAKIIPGLFKTF